MILVNQFHSLSRLILGRAAGESQPHEQARIKNTEIKGIYWIVDDSPRDYDRKEGKHRKTVTNKQYIFFYLVFTTDKQYVSSLQRF